MKLLYRRNILLFESSFYTVHFKLQQ
jgi:hypothetical protein